MAGKIISLARMFAKAFYILKTQGPGPLIRRAVVKILANVRAATLQRRQDRAWKYAVRLHEPAGQKNKLTFVGLTSDVTIIIPVCGNDVFIYNCLRSINDHLDEGVAAEIIVIDDGGPASTQTLLASMEGIRCIRSEQSKGFAASCNRGAEFASSELLVFLNYNTIVQQGWLSALVRRKRSDLSIGAVGSKLLAPDRAVAEAGAIIWRDGSSSWFGRGGRYDDPAYNYVRDADYCASASLLVNRQEFFDAGCFDLRYSSARYEAADLCFALRSQGLRTVVEPGSVVVLFENVAAKIEQHSGVGEVQFLNNALFAKKWARELQTHEPRDLANVARAARRLSGRPRILAIDTFVPFDDRDAGSLRLSHLITLMLGLDCDVTFYPHDGVAHEPYTSKLREQGVEVVCNGRRLKAEVLLRERIRLFDVAWICRPELMSVYAPLLRSNTACRIYYDTVDLHFLRLARQEQITGCPTGWRRMRQIEIQLAKDSDGTIVTSPVELEILAANGVSNIHVVPPMQLSVTNSTPWSARAGVLFLGNYTHAPNVDAAIFLAEKIFPLMARSIPGLRLTLVGNEPPQAVRALQSDSINVTGYVDRVEPFLQCSRVFIAPLRFGAGVKGKILQTMAHGLPAVTTPIGAEGIGLRHGIDALIGSSATDLANFAISLYEQPEWWEQVSEAARYLSKQYTPAAVEKNVRRVLAAAYPGGFGGGPR